MAQYADIKSITAVSEANYGDRVNVSVSVKNLYSADIGILVVGVPDYSGAPSANYIDGMGPRENSKTVGPGSTATFTGSFIMPNAKVTIHIYSYWYGTDQLWHLDDEMTKVVNLKSVPSSQFGSINITSYSTT